MPDVKPRIAKLEAMRENLPDALNIRFDHARAERDEIKAQISRLQADVSVLKVEMKALPRVIAELLKP